MTNKVAQAGENVVDVVHAQLGQQGALMRTAMDWLVENGMAFLVNMLVALLMLAIGRGLIHLAGRAIRTALRRTGRVNELLESFAVSSATKIMWALLIMMVLQKLGVNVAPLIAGLGVTGFIVGFACQESLANLAAGIMIAINQPFKVGDFVEIGGNMGVVRELNMMAATLTTGDNKRVVVPNKVIWGAPITNYTAMDVRRVDMTVGISYGSDIALARRLILDVFTASGLVLSDPEPVVGVLAMADSSVNLAMRPWVKTPDYWTAYFMIMQNVKTAFEANGITIPFPQMEVYLKEMPKI